MRFQYGPTTNDKITANRIFDLKHRIYDQKKFSWMHGITDQTSKEKFSKAKRSKKNSRRLKLRKSEVSKKIE